MERELRHAVFTDVFERLAAGFVDGRRRRGLAAETPQTLGEVHGGTLLLLSRVLFLLSAEARGLLPADGPYARHGIAPLRARLAEMRVPGHVLSPQSNDVWRDLSALFDLLSRGGASFGFPAYGGPFTAETVDGRFLRENGVSDFFLVPALDKLSRDADGRFLDFSGLVPDEVAGALEGIIGLRLAADERGKPVLVDPRGDRKAAPGGTPPRWLVEFVVEQTVLPALAEREAAYRETLREAAARRERAAAAVAETAARLEREAASLEDRAVDTLLGLRVLDPACGTGRFLAHAAEAVAARLSAVLAESPRGPLAARLAEARAGAAARLIAQGIAPEPGTPDDDALLRRLAVKHCIFGVDVDPAAVQATRLALWLTAFVPGVPLPALEPHVKRGNALVGARVLELQRAMEESPAGQFDAFGGPFRGLLRTASAVRHAVASEDATPAGAAETLRRHTELEAALDPHRRLLDVWVSRDFGNRLAEELASLHADDVLEAARGGRPRLGRAHAEALEQAAALAAAHSIFHWDLEFPEAFVDPETATWSEDPGFDALIGRPPAGRDEHAAALRPHLSVAFAQVYDASADVHAYFWEQGVRLLRRGGRVAYAVPDRWMRSQAGAALRRYLGEHELEQLVDFRAAGAQVEVDAACVLVVRRTGGWYPSTPETRIAVLPADEVPPRLGAFTAEQAYSVPRIRFGSYPWSLERPEVQRLIDRITGAGVPLRDYLGASPATGARTGLNDAFVVDDATRGRIVAAHSGAADLLHPLIRTQEIERWAAAWGGAWLIAIPSSDERAWPWSGAADGDAEALFQRSYPSLHAHLKPWEERLRARHDQGRYWWEQRPRGERSTSGGARIIHPDSAAQPQFALADGNAQVLANACAWPTGDPYLLAVANSAVAWTWLWRTTLHGRDDVLRLTPTALETLPIAAPAPQVEEEIAVSVDRLVEITMEKRQAAGELFAWLAAEYAITPSDAGLMGFAELNATAFVEAVRRHRPKTADTLVPREVGMLRNAHAEVTPRVTALQARAAGLERKVAQLVIRAYALTPVEVELLAAAAPRRTIR